MKKIIGLTVALIAVIAMLGTGTWAYFNDVATSTGNSVTAGKLFLTAGGIATTPVHLGGAGFKPGDKGNMGSTTLINGGDIVADLFFKTSNLANTENTLTAVETKMSDTGPAGELGGLLTLAVWVDVANNGWTAGTDYYFDATGAPINAGAIGSIGTVPDAAYITTDTLLGAGILGTEKTLATSVAAGATVGTMKFEYNFPKHVGSHFTLDSDNLAQDDVVAFDLNWALVQN